MNDGEWTTKCGVTVLYQKKSYGGRAAVKFAETPLVHVAFPNSAHDTVDVLKPYPSLEEAKSAAKEMADQINRIAPMRFPMLRQSFKPDMLAAREAIEAHVREWAGSEAIVIEIEE